LLKMLITLSFLYKQLRFSRSEVIAARLLDKIIGVTYTL